MSPKPSKELPEDIPESEPAADGLKAERNTIIGWLLALLLAVVGFFLKQQMDRISSLEDRLGKHQDRLTVIETVLKQQPALHFPSN